MRRWMHVHEQNPKVDRCWMSGKSLSNNLHRVSTPVDCSFAFCFIISSQNQAPTFAVLKSGIRAGHNPSCA
jgi:hypothetical protein